MQITTTRPVISTRLQQHQLAGQEDTAHTTAVEKASGPTKKDPNAHRAKRATADRSGSKKKEADSSKSDEQEAGEDHEARSKPKHKKKKKAVHTTAGGNSGEDSTVSTPTYTAELSYPGLGCNCLLPQIYDDAYDGYAEEMHGTDEEMREQTDGGAEGDDGHGVPHR